jgi:hypothetical protein
MLAVLVGAILMYVWASAIHMSPLAMIGFSQLKDDTVVSQVQQATGDKPGMYMYPYVDMRSKDAMKVAATKLRTMPSGMIFYHRAGAPMLTPTQLLGELLLELIETFVAVMLMMRTGITSFWGRVGFMCGVGVVAAVATNASYWLWYGYPTDYTLVNMLIEVGKFFFAGVGAAFVLGMKPKGATMAAAA